MVAYTLAGGLSITAVVVLCCCWSKCSKFKSLICQKDGEKDHKMVEAMLKQYGPLAATRYRYQDIKKMTISFKYKLGQGGNGAVYKGILNDGRLVAVKILNKLKGSGEEFVNEVISSSKTSHINIVTLLGFCYERSKRGLIYEFMPNGSLDKFIYNEKSSNMRQLGWQKLYQIALGIARGLEYMHRGCNTRILHFDIKPHIIFQEFCPKIADFGLAKLCLGKDSVISMLGMRGTPGYIAPEVFSRNFGGVSHKSDVYSYGMMILEMVGGRRNSDQGADRTSEKYFPQWIYNRLQLDVEIGQNGIVSQAENECTRKMVMVGMWCIQTDPSNRPSMGKVLEMLEGSLEALEIPSKPFLVSSPKSLTDSSST